MTLSTQYAGEAFERSKEAAENLKRLGCFSVYNPNTDCPDARTEEQKKAGTAEKGQSNWLEEFRKSLMRSRASGTNP